jgi:predicted pyridoxine 5'-phosphate oxidase superfamily flavin-nucleotide-binding protein
MEKYIEQFILSADSKALATLSPDGIINVVPVSSIKVVDGKIILVNYFMDKTLENITANNKVSLVAWSKMVGYQIKGSVEYTTQGNVFDDVVIWIKETIPSRTVKGVLIISPEEIHDIAPGKNTKESLV